MNIFFKQEVQISTKCLRTLDYKDDILAIGCHDQKLYLLSTEHMSVLHHFDFFDSEIYSVRFLTQDRIAIGCNDHKIYIVTTEGDLLGILEGHTEKVNSLSTHNNLLASGSWDATCRIWNLDTFEQIDVLPDHSYAVTVCFLPNGNLVTGSQNGTLNLFSPDGFGLIRSVNAHSDIVRDIKYFNKQIVTASNDCSVKLWTEDLNEIFVLQGHASFVFAVGILSNQLGDFIFSGGEDFKIKAFKDGKEYGNIPFPTCIWSIYAFNKSDIAVASEDGKLRIFTINQGTIEWNKHERYIESAEIAGLKNPEITEDDLKKFPSIDQKNTLKGKKDGEVKVFINNGKGEAYVWQGSKWEYLGEMLGSNPKSRYEGDRFFPAGEYDYVFNIEDESGLGRKLPFNKGDNSLMAAEKFLAREQLSVGYKEQILNFIKHNTSGATNTSKIVNAMGNTPQNNNHPEVKTSGKHLKLFPVIDSIFYENFNAEALNKKIIEIHNTYKNSETDKHKAFTTSEMIAFNGIISKLSDPITMQQKDLIETEQHLINAKLLTWMNFDAVPILDLLRVYLLHYKSEELFNSVDSGLKFLVYAISLAKYNDERYFSLILRFFANIFKHNGLSFDLNESIIHDFLDIKSPLFESKTKSLFLIVYNNYLSFLIEKNRHKSIRKFFDVIFKLDWSFVVGNDFDSTNYLIAVGNSIVFNEPDVIEMCKHRLGFIKQLNSASNDALKQDIIAYFES